MRDKRGIGTQLPNSTNVLVQFRFFARRLLLLFTSTLFACLRLPFTLLWDSLAAWWYFLMTFCVLKFETGSRSRVHWKSLSNVPDTAFGNHPFVW